MSRWTAEFRKGILSENPLTILILGLCPALAVTTTAINGISMGVATLAVMLASNVLVSMLRNYIPSNVRIPAFIVIIASFVTIVDFTMAAYVPDLHEALGIFIPLIVVNCIIMGRAEAFASKNPVRLSVADALGMGIGFTWALAVIGAVREVLGAGTLLGAPLFGESFQPAIMMILPPGGFIVLGLLIGVINLLQRKSRERTRAARQAELAEAREQARTAAGAGEAPA